MIAFPASIHSILLVPQIPEKVRVSLDIEIILSGADIRVGVWYHLVEGMDLIDETIGHKNYTKSKRNVFGRGGVVLEVSPL